jgi:protein SCO1/2
MERSREAMDTNEGESLRATRVRPLIWSVLVATLLCTTILVASQVWENGPQAHNLSLLGTSLGASPAPAFALVDQDGGLISLEHLRGQPVVVTFLYTHCPGPCPLTAGKLHQAIEQLGTKADEVAWVALSLDPHGDTPAAATTFVATHQLSGYLHFLLGSDQQLAPLWQAYAVAVRPAQGAEEATAGPVVHAVGAFVLDQRGRERVYLDDMFTPASLATDLTRLLDGQS